MWLCFHFKVPVNPVANIMNLVLSANAHKSVCHSEMVFALLMATELSNHYRSEYPRVEPPLTQFPLYRTIANRG
jgi:hypothetical protein